MKNVDCPLFLKQYQNVVHLSGCEQLQIETSLKIFPKPLIINFKSSRKNYIILYQLFRRIRNIYFLEIHV